MESSRSVNSGSGSSGHKEAEFLVFVSLRGTILGDQQAASKMVSKALRCAKGSVDVGTIVCMSPLPASS